MKAPRFFFQPGHGELPEHVVFHVGQEFRVILVLVMVGVNVDDHHVVEVALVRLLAGVSEQPRGVQLLDRYAATAIGDEIHSVSPGVPIPLTNGFYRPVQLCHMPSSKTARSAAFNNPLAVTITSVAEIEFFAIGVNCSPASMRAV